MESHSQVELREAVLRAARLESEGRYSEALGEVAPLIAARPADRQLGFQRSRVIIRNSSYAEGLTEADSFEQLYGPCVSSNLLRAWVSILAGRAEGAIPYIDAAEAIGGAVPSVLQHRSMALRAMGRADEALKLLDAAPRTSSIIETIERTNCSQTEDVMLESSRSLAGTGADPGRVALFLARWYAKVGLMARALDELRSANERDPANLAVAGELADYLDRSGDELAARELLRKTFDADPAAREIAGHLMGIARRRRRWPEANYVLARHAVARVKWFESPAGKTSIRRSRGARLRD